MSEICNSSVSEFPYPDECSSPTNQQIQTACACLQTTNANIRGINQYCASIQAWQQVKDAYNSAKDKHSEWENKLKREKTEYQNQKKKWKNCVAWGQEAWTNKNDDWCADEFGQGWMRVRDSSGIVGAGGCWYGMCTPGSEAMRIWEDKWKSDNHEPTIPASPGNAPDFYNVNNVQCCSQVFSNITAKTSNIHDISQDCNQTINTQISAAVSGEIKSTPAPVSPVTTKKATKTTTTKPPSKKGSKSSTDDSIWIIVAAIALCCCCCSSFALAFFLMNKKGAT